MTAGTPRRLVLPGLGSAGADNAARVLDSARTVLAAVAEPESPPGVQELRDAVILAALEADFGDAVLAGVAFAPRWGGDAVGFT